MDKYVQNGYSVVMARPKEFIREEVLARAKAVFWKQGYAATTTDDLRLAMGIGRQSFYDTFKNKHEVFLEVLDRYNSDKGQELSAILRKHESPLKTLETILSAIADEEPQVRALGCMGVSSVCEFGTSDEKVNQVNHRAGEIRRLIFESLLADAKAAGEIRASVDVKATALYLQMVMTGMRVSSKGGVKPKELREMVKVVIGCLKN